MSIDLNVKRLIVTPSNDMVGNVGYSKCVIHYNIS